MRATHDPADDVTPYDHAAAVLNEAQAQEAGQDAVRVVMDALAQAHTRGHSEGYRQRELTQAYLDGVQAVRGRPKGAPLDPDEDYDSTPGPARLDAAPPAHARPPGRTPDGSCSTCKASAAEQHNEACPFYPPGGYARDGAPVET